MGSSVQIMDVRNGNPRRYNPKLSDVISIEWSVLQISVIQKQAESARAAEAKASR
jgi:hypothetical protein